MNLAVDLHWKNGNILYNMQHGNMQLSETATGGIL